MPQLALSWRLPLIRRFENSNVVVEPISALYVAPNAGSQRNLPNEDSRGLTFDDTSLFRLNRFSGYDRLESGQRLVTGVNTEWSNRDRQRFSVFLGQQYRMNDESALPAGSGADTRFSDFVGRIIASPHEWFGANYRFQIDNRNRELLRSVSTIYVGPQALRYAVSHTRVDRSIQPTALSSINQMSHSVATRFNEVWRLTGRVVQSLGQDDGILLAGATLIYDDDCFLWGIDLQRRNIGRAEIPPDTAILFRFGFRNLGELALRGL